MGSFVDFSSWPREQEQSFVVFEQHAQESQSKAWIVAAICSTAFFAFAVFVFFAIDPVHVDLTKGMNMDNLAKKKKEKVEAPAATPDKPAEKPAAPAEKTEAPAEAPK